MLAPAPETALNDGFTVTIGSMRGQTEALPPLPGIGRVLLTERVYPLAASGPVAFIPSTSIIRTGPHHRVVVPEGWRSLDAIAPVPSVLAGLGMLQPAPGRSTPTVPPTATEPATGSSRPGPDLVTVLFLLAILAFIGVVVRRNIGRTRQDVGDDLAHNPESIQAMADDLRELLATLDPKAREALRRALTYDQGRPRRDRLAAAPLPRRGEATTGPTSSTC